MPTNTRYAGSGWLKETLKPRGRFVSVFGAQVAEILGELYQGIYHIQSSVLKRKVDWASDRWIQVTVYGGMATFDSDKLTRLVFLCHERCIRCEVSGAGPNFLKLSFSPRKSRDGSIYDRHPTLKTAVKAWETGQQA